jgi:hypothetical protein
MPRLPDAMDMPQLPSARSGRGVATFDTTAIGRGQEALGRSVASGAEAEGAALQQLGNAGFKAGRSAILYDQHEREKVDELNEAKARSSWLVNKTQLDEQRDRETDQEKLKAYPDSYKAAADNAAAVIGDPRKQELFKLTLEPQVAVAQKGVGERVFGLQRDLSKADAQVQLDQLQDAGLRAKDEATRAEVVRSGQALISRLENAGYMTPDEAVLQRKKWAEGYATKAISALPAADRLGVLRGPPTDREGVLDRFKANENATKNTAAQNPDSSAMGDFQFIKGTWAQMIAKYKPELAQGRKAEELVGDRNIQAMRADPKLSRELAGKLMDENAAALKSAGVEATPGNLYLAHFLGSGEAVKVLKSDPGAPVSSLVSPKAVESNRSVLEGRTAGTVAAWANRKMGGASPELASLSGFIPENTKIAMREVAENEIIKDTAQSQAAMVRDSAALGETFERQIIDGASGKAPLIARSAIETEPGLQDTHRNTLLRQYDAAKAHLTKSTADITGFNTALATPGFTWNPIDKDHKDFAEAGFLARGGGLPAAQSVVNDTGIVPPSAAKALRGALVSTDPTKVANAATVASNLLVKNPQIFAGVDGGSDLEDAGTKMSHYVERFGMTAEEAGKKIIEENSPEFKQKLAKIKAEDVNEILKKQVTVNDMRSAFDTSWWPGSPQVEFTPQDRQSAYSDYTDLFKDNYMRTGDVSLSKTLAANQMKKVWGVSQVSGSDVIMRFPPEKQPAMAGVPDPAGHIAMQATEAIKSVAGEDVSRNKIILKPLAGGQTARAYMAGEPAPYALSWFDKNGTLQMLDPRKAFVADPGVAKDKLTQDRKKKFDISRAASDVVDPDLARANFGVQ